MEVMRVVGVIQTMAAAVAGTLLEAAVLQEATDIILQVTVSLLQVTVLFLLVAVLLLRAAVTHQAVGAIHREVVGIHLEVAVIPCRQRSLAGVGLEVHLYRRAKWDTMSALRQTSPI